MNKEQALAVFEDYKSRLKKEAGETVTKCNGLKKEGSETVINCHQLKMKAPDGKIIDDKGIKSPKILEIN